MPDSRQKKVTLQLFERDQFSRERNLGFPTRVFDITDHDLKQHPVK